MQGVKMQNSSLFYIPLQPSCAVRQPWFVLSFGIWRLKQVSGRSVQYM